MTAPGETEKVSFYQRNDKSDERGLFMIGMMVLQFFIKKL